MISGFPVVNLVWKNDIPKTPLFKQHSVAVQNGYAYVFTGITIKLEYTGIPVSKKNVLIPGAGFDYGTFLGGVYRAASAEDQALVDRFPYMNLEQDGLYYWLQNDFIDPTAVANVVNQFKPDYQPLYVEFEVYQKFKLECGFPKCKGQMTQQQFARNGKCGLQTFMNTPIVINRNGLSPEEAKKYKDKFKETLKKLDEYAKELEQKRKQLWNHGQTIAQNVWNKHVSQQNFMRLANQMLPGLSLIPKECMKTACEAVRKSKGENSIKGISEAIKNGIDESKLSMTKVVKDFQDGTKAAYKAVGDLAKSAWNTVGQLASTMNIYKLCPRRFNDWLEQAADKFGLPDAIGQFTQLQNMFANNIMRIF